MAHLLMPKATAVWLVENTALTFIQIAEFCGLHELEVNAIADQEVAVGMVGLDPLANGQLTQAEIDRCSADPNARLVLAESDLPAPKSRSKGPRYTPVTKRGDKPDAITWLLKTHPELSDAAISRLIGTTKPTINAVRDRTHWNAANIKSQHPVLLGLCTQKELEEALSKVRRSSKSTPKAPAMADADEPALEEVAEGPTLTDFAPDSTEPAEPETL